MKKWEIFWEIPDCPPFLTSEPARMFTSEMRGFCGSNFKDCILEYKKNNNIWYLDANAWTQLDKKLFDKVIQNVAWAKKINNLPAKTCVACLRFLDQLKKKEVKSLSNVELYQLYTKFMNIYIPAHGSGHPANVLEMKNQRLSNYLKQYLKNRIAESNNGAKANEYFTILATPTRDMSPQQEAKEFYTIAKKISIIPKLVHAFKIYRVGKIKKLVQLNYPRIYNQILQHHTNWCWTPYNYEGPSYAVDYYYENFKSILKQKINIAKDLTILLKENKNILRQQQSIIKKFGIDIKHRALFKIAEDIIFYKALRKDCIYKGAWASENLFNEIGKRLGLTTHQARFIFNFEMKSALLYKKYNKNNIKMRAREVVLHLRENKRDIILTGAKAYGFIKSLAVQKADTRISELHGQCAYPGKITGKVVLVNTPAMIGKIRKGDILMAYATQPNLLPAMKKASAFITDFGGITCHAAIVAREWKVPCVIGTGNATKILKDGDIVEVDATNGLVKKIK